MQADDNSCKKDIIYFIYLINAFLPIKDDLIFMLKVDSVLWLSIFSKKGDCKGQCVLEGKVVSILVLDDVQGFTFDIFELPGYCTCKNIS